MAVYWTSPAVLPYGFHVVAAIVDSRWETVNHAVLPGASITLAFIVQLGTAVIHARHWTSGWNVFEMFPLEVTMDQWAQNNWILIHIWSIAWLLYGFLLLHQKMICNCMKMDNKPCGTDIHPPTFYLTWAIASICAMFLWAKYDVVETLVFKWIIPVSSFCMLAISYHNLSKYREWLASHSPSQIWWIRYLTQNGLALFAWWTLLEALLCLGIVLRYKAGLQDPLVSSLILTIILLFITTWFVFERFLFTRHMRYTFTAYPMLFLGLSAMFTRSYGVSNWAANTIYCGFLMVIVTILSSVHVISVCFTKDRSSELLTTEPRIKFDGCETVCKAVSTIEATRGIIMKDKL